MSTYVKKQLRFSVSELENGQDVIISRGDKEIRFDDVAALEEAEILKYSIPIPTSDKDLLEGSTIATGKILYIEVDGEVTIKLDDTGDTGFVVKPVVTADAATKRGMLYLEGEFTHVYCTAAGTSGSVNIIMAAVGA